MCAARAVGQGVDSVPSSSVFSGQRGGCDCHHSHKVSRSAAVTPPQPTQPTPWPVPARPSATTQASLCPASACRFCCRSRPACHSPLRNWYARARASVRTMTSREALVKTGTAHSRLAAGRNRQYPAVTGCHRKPTISGTLVNPQSAARLDPIAALRHKHTNNRSQPGARRTFSPFRPVLSVR